jgi:hypothetical protein
METAPKDGTRVLVLRRHGLICIGRCVLAADDWWESDVGQDITPTHWMPLPEVP